MAARPRARKGAATARTPRVESPTPGQDYFKQPLDEPASRLVLSGARLERPMDGELGGFFEDYLYDQYRRGSEEEGHLLCFPVVVLPRGELSGLLRLPVRLTFMNSADQPFVVPSRSQRRRSEFPAPPTGIRLLRAERSEGDFPFFVDSRLLHQQLGLDQAAIDDLFSLLRGKEALSERQMLQAVTEALLQGDEASSHPRDAQAADPIAELVRATQQRLERTSRLRAYAQGIVISASRSKVTWHLQQDLTALLRDLEHGPVTEGGPLQSYLGPPPALLGRGLQRALAEGPALTARQRDVADHFWGSTLSSVQGPPGTGKTTLIRHLAAEFLVRKVEQLVDHGQMGEDMLVLVSSNNRAVDHALAPFMGSDQASDSLLPIALRAGSRQVCEHVLSPQLRRAAIYLADAQAQPEDARKQALSLALDRFAGVREQVQQGMVERAAAIAHAEQRSTLERELSKLPPDLDSASQGRELSKALLSAAQALHKRLEALSKLCDARVGLPALSAVARHFERTRKKELAAFVDEAAGCGCALQTRLPPDLPPSVDSELLMEHWHGAVEAALTELESMLAAHAHGREIGLARQRRAELERRLNGSGPAETIPPPSAAQEAMRALFECATHVWQAWAAVNAAPLSAAVERALQTVAESRSLRGLFRDAEGTWKDLSRLFGLWGSTLLSMGNSFPGAEGSIARVIIDEAGQCHPAHAVSALLRARAVMVIGDVHQLPPVIELTKEDERRVAQQVSRGAAVPPERFRVHGESHTSAQSLSDQAVQQRLSLRDHFRCQAEIIALCDRLSGYDLSVHTAARSRSRQLPALTAPVMWWDVVGSQERLGGSYCNERELSAVQRLLTDLLAGGIAPEDVAIITPFRGQLERLRRMFVGMGLALESSPELLDEAPSRGQTTGLALGTVHRFQGGERSVVLFTLTASARRPLMFLNERPNLLNVAISRAQDHLICIGDRSLACQGALTGMLAKAAKPFVLTPSGHPTAGNAFADNDNSD